MSILQTVVCAKYKHTVQEDLRLSATAGQVWHYPIDLLFKLSLLFILSVGLALSVLFKEVY